MYTYPGLHLLVKLAVTLSLLWASTATGHTAAWIGVSHRTAKWVQAGIEQSGSGQPYLYVEWKTRHSSPHLLTEPWSTHERVRALIQRKGHAMWRAGTGGMWTPWTYIRYTFRCSTMELWNDAHGAATIGGRFVSG